MCQNTFSDSDSEEESRGNQVNPQYTITPGGSHEENAAVVMPESHSLSQRVEKHRQQLSRITFVAPPYSNESELDPASSSVNVLGSGVHTMAFRFAPAESTATAMARASEAYLQRIQENRRRLSRMTFSVSSPKFDESENGAASASPVNVPDHSQRLRASQFRDTWFPSQSQLQQAQSTIRSPAINAQHSDFKSLCRSSQSQFASDSSTMRKTASTIPSLVLSTASPTTQGIPTRITEAFGAACVFQISMYQQRDHPANV